MDSHQQQEETMNNNMNNNSNNNNNNNGGGCGKISTSSSNYMCRQTSTRWTPTTEQIKLLKELYYINGVRSPTADQIQTICARLRRYGKIEGKNVFYWFQNHKARERQKKRLIHPNNNPNPNPNPNLHANLNPNANVVRNGQVKYHPINNHPGIACSSSSGGVINGGGNFGYGAVTMENKFRDCSISGGGTLNGGGNMNMNMNMTHNYQWAAAAGNYNPYAPHPYSNFLGKTSAVDEDHDHQDHDDVPEIETLPLFPMHKEDHHDHDHDYKYMGGSDGYNCIGGSDGYNYMGGYRWGHTGGGGGPNNAASLELSLNSYGYGACYSPNY